jgi:acetyltransferase
MAPVKTSTGIAPSPTTPTKQTKQTKQTNLERLFAPKSVAVVGASASPAKAGYQAMLALASFGGEVFAINPNISTVLDRPAFPSLRALSRPVDLVIFALPAAGCVTAVREAI